MNQFEIIQRIISNLFLEAVGHDRVFLLRFLMEKMDQQDREVQAMWFAEKYVDADWNAAKEYQRRKGMKEGIKEGKKEMTLELLKKGVAPDIIAASADVPVETVEQWARQNKKSVGTESKK